MPGLSAFYGNVQRELDNLHMTLDKMLHFKNWSKKEIYKSRNFFIGFTGYGTYPLKAIQKDDLFITIEGYIYNKNIENIISVCNEALNQISCSKRNFGDFSSKLEDFDGEFLVFCLNKNDKSFILFNDILERLPFYYLFDEDKLFMSRELKFFKFMKNDLEIDKLSVAYQLLFNCFLYNSTYFKNVKRLKPGSMIYYDEGRDQMNVEEYFKLNFEQQKVSERSTDEDADYLTKLFLKSCENRLKQIEYDKLVLALSDGFDSRTVLAALNNFTRDIYIITYTGWKREREEKLCSEIAKNVAYFHENRWEPFSLTQTDVCEMENMVKLYDATIPSVSPWHQLLPYVEKKYDKRILFFTGDDGNRTLAPISSSEIRNAKDIYYLIDVIFSKFSFRLFSLQDVQELLNIGGNEIIDFIKNLFFEFPEKTLLGKYIHSNFIIRDFNWNFTREDEYRYYFWYTSLFWSPLFAKDAIPLRSKYKSYNELYIKVMKRLNACMTEPTDSYAFKKTYLQKIRENLRYIKILNRLYHRIKRIRKNEAKTFEPYIMRDINEYKNAPFQESCIFNQKVLNKFANNFMNKAHFERLFTVSKYCQDLFEKINNKSTKKNLRRDQFEYL